MENNMNIVTDSRQFITDALIKEVFKDAKKLLTDKEYQALYISGSVVKVINTIYDYVLMDNLYDNNNIVDIYDYKDGLEYLNENLHHAISYFYETNRKLLNDDFTLNNNFYFTDLRCFIVDLENSLRQERQGK
jgi:hypothetical protein